MSSPFVLFKMQPTSVLGDTETVILSSVNTAIVDSIFIVNTFNKPILVELLMSRTNGETTSAFLFRNSFVIDELSWKEVLSGSTLTLESTDSLTAKSRLSDYTFNSFVSYRQLTELPEA